MKTYTVRHVESGTERVEMSYRDAKDALLDLIQEIGDPVEIWRNDRNGNPVEKIRTSTGLWTTYHYLPAN